MSMTRRFLSLVVLGVLPLIASARDYSLMYPANDLRQANGVYSPNIRGMLFEDVAPYLLDNELATLERVRMSQPWDRTKDPFEFAVNSDTGVILVPTLSVKFFDDLSISTAWFERFGCNKEVVFDYVAALDFSDLDLPAPLTALSVPHDAYKRDTFVNDVSQKILKSALVFILLHELGHVHHRHRPYHEIDTSQALAQETEADRFAMRVLRRMRLPPMGMTVWFMAASMRDPLVVGSPRQTHPLSSSRLEAIAQELRTHPEDFIEPANRGKITVDRIRSIANDIDGIGRGLASADLRSFLRERGRKVTPDLLSGACETLQHDQE